MKTGRVARPLDTVATLAHPRSNGPQPRSCRQPASLPSPATITTMCGTALPVRFWLPTWPHPTPPRPHRPGTITTTAKVRLKTEVAPRRGDSPMVRLKTEIAPETRRFQNGQIKNRDCPDTRRFPNGQIKNRDCPETRRFPNGQIKNRGRPETRRFPNGRLKTEVAPRRGDSPMVRLKTEVAQDEAIPQWSD